MLKRAAAVAAVLVSMTVSLFAANPFDEFRNQLVSQGTAVAQERLDSFTKDLGAVMGGGSYHQGESLGILGFDVGVQVPVKKVDDQDVIIKQSSLDSIALPILQVEKGLPMDIDIIARFTTFQSATMFGVGVRYGLFKSDIPGLPGISLQAIYNKLDVSADLNKLSATTISADAVVSIGLPIITPYLGVGIDKTEVTPDSTIVDLKGTAQTTHIEGGVNLALIPFTYIKIGATMIDGSMGYDAGLGVKF